MKVEEITLAIKMKVEEINLAILVILIIALVSGLTFSLIGFKTTEECLLTGENASAAWPEFAIKYIKDNDCAALKTDVYGLEVVLVCSQEKREVKVNP